MGWPFESATKHSQAGSQEFPVSATQQALAKNDPILRSQNTSRYELANMLPWTLLRRLLLQVCTDLSFVEKEPWFGLDRASGVIHSWVHNAQLLIGDEKNANLPSMSFGSVSNVESHLQLLPHLQASSVLGYALFMNGGFANCSVLQAVRKGASKGIGRKELPRREGLISYQRVKL